MGKTLLVSRGRVQEGTMEVFEFLKKDTILIFLLLNDTHNDTQMTL